MLRDIPVALSPQMRQLDTGKFDAPEGGLSSTFTPKLPIKESSSFTVFWDPRRPLDLVLGAISGVPGYPLSVELLFPLTIVIMPQSVTPCSEFSSEILYNSNY